MKHLDPHTARAQGLHEFTAKPGRKVPKAADMDARRYAAAKRWRLVGFYDETDKLGMVTRRYWAEALAR